MIYVIIPTKKNQFYIQINEQTKKKTERETQEPTGKHTEEQTSTQVKETVIWSNRHLLSIKLEER